MFEPVKKIVLLCSLAAGITLFSAACAHAQKIEAEVLSAEEWVENYGDATIKANLKLIHGGQMINCGNLETICDKGTQDCLKCTYTYKKGWKIFGRDEHHVTIGKCAPKGAINKYVGDGRSEFFGGDCAKHKGSVTTSDIGFDNNDDITTRYTFGDNEYEQKYDSFTGTDNKKYSMIKYGGVATIVMGDNNEFNGCEVLPVKIYNMSACFFCPLADLIFTAANEVTVDAFKYFGSAFRVVIAMVFCIWLALAVLGQVFPMTKQDAPKFLAAILKQGFKFMLAFTLLFYGNDLFRYFVVPVLDSGLVLGTGIQTVSMPAPKNYKKSEPKTDRQYYNLPRADGTTLYNRIEEYLASLQARLSYMQAIGTTVFCVGSHKVSFWDLVFHQDDFKAGLRMMMLGGVLTSFSFLLTMAFAFYFMDAILQMAVIGAMIPFMIAGWPFRATAQYAGIGFKMLLNTFFAMFFTGFVISVNVELINQSLALSQDKNTGAVSEAPKKETSAELDAAKSETGAGFQAITDAINNQNWTEINEATNIGGTGFLLLAFCCIFGFKFVAQVTPLASKLAAGGFSKGGIAGKIGTMAASAAKGMAAKAAAPVGKVAGNAALGAVGSVAQKAGNAAGGVVGGAAKLAGKGLSAAGGAVSGHGGLAGKALGGALKGAGAIADKAGSAANAVGRGVGNIAKGTADGMKKQ